MSQTRIRSKLSQSPNDTVIAALHFLSYEELCKASCVSKQFQNLITSAHKQMDKNLQLDKFFEILKVNQPLEEKSGDKSSLGHKDLSKWIRDADYERTKDSATQALSDLHLKLKQENNELISSEEENILSDIYLLIRNLDLIENELASDVFSEHLSNTKDIDTTLYLKLLDKLSERSSLRNDIAKQLLINFIWKQDITNIQIIYTYCKENNILNQNDFSYLLSECSYNFSQSMYAFCEDLVNNGADPNYRLYNFDNNTILGSSIFTNRLETSKFLLEHGADPHHSFLLNGHETPISEYVKKHGSDAMKNLFNNFLSDANKNADDDLDHDPNARCIFM